MEFRANEGKSVTIEVGGKTYARHAIQTHFVQVGESYIDLVEQYVKPEAARWHTLDDIAKTLDGCIAKLAEVDQTVNTKYFRELVM